MGKELTMILELKDGANLVIPNISALPISSCEKFFVKATHW